MRDRSWIFFSSSPKDFPSVLPPAGEVWNLKNMRVEVISSQFYNNFSEATVQVSFVNDEVRASGREGDMGPLKRNNI